MCANCKRKEKEIPPTKRGIVWTMEHIVPVDDDGAHAVDNVEVLCYSCNSAKRNKSPEQWEFENGRFPLNYGAR